MFLILALSIGAPPSDLELEKAKAAVAVALAIEKLNGKQSSPLPFPCPNCTGCEKGCSCFGGGYYCAEGKCSTNKPLHFDRFTATDGTVYELCPDGFYRVVTKAPEVVVPKGNTFQLPRYSPGHQCPECGRSQYVVSGFNADGSHTHVCSAGHSWRH